MMPDYDFSHLSTEQRLELIDALWDSIDQSSVPLRDWQAEIIDQRLATLDQDIQKGRDAFEFVAELKTRFLS